MILVVTPKHPEISVLRFPFPSLKFPFIVVSS
jgi:hypothetical protein